MKSRCRFIAAIVCAVSPWSASAEWHIETLRDRLNDRDVNVATVAAKAPDHGITAQLEMTCSGDSTYYHVVLSAKMTRGKIGASYRIDERRQRSHFLDVFSDPYRISIIEYPPFTLARAKRFRIELEPNGGPVLFYDFDISGVDHAIKIVQCH